MNCRSRRRVPAGITKTVLLGLIGLFAFMGSGVCEDKSRHPPFAWHYHMSHSDMIVASPLIVIAQVRRLQAIDDTIDGTDDRGNHHGWQLTKASVTIENVLKGQLRQNSLDFFFYLSVTSLSGDWNALDIGGRYVFFLKQEGDLVRAIRDHWRSNIPIGTGRHSVLPLSSAILFRSA
jgi:hypothetical protein